MAMNRQKTRWMLLGWLGRAHHLIYLASVWSYASEDEKRCTWIQPFFTASQSRKLMLARELILEVLEDIKGKQN